MTTRRGLQAGKTNRTSSAAGNMLHVRVTYPGTGRVIANLQLPLSTVEAGIRIGARLIPEIEGVDKTQVMNAIRSGARGKILDLTNESAGEHIEIFIE